MSIQKMEFHILDAAFVGLPPVIEVQYNPKQHTEQSGAVYMPEKVIGKKEGPQEYTRTTSKKLTFELFFDSTQELTVRDVKHTWVDPLMRLMEECVPVQNEGNMKKLRPPRVKLIWGGELIVGHVEDVKASYLMYAECGARLRARVSITMVQSEPTEPGERGGPLSHLSADGIQLVMPAGGTLTQLAARLGVDYRQLLADNPHIDDPMNLSVEQILLVSRSARRIHFEAAVEGQHQRARWESNYAKKRGSS